MNLKVITFQRHELEEVDERATGEHLSEELDCALQEKEGKQLVNTTESAGTFRERPLRISHPISSVFVRQ